VPFRNKKGISSNDAALLQQTYQSLLEQTRKRPQAAAHPRPSAKACRAWARLTLNGETSRISFLIPKGK
jgi:hypothetical protein